MKIICVQSVLDSCTFGRIFDSLTVFDFRPSICVSYFDNSVDVFLIWSLPHFLLSDLMYLQTSKHKKLSLLKCLILQETKCIFYKLGPYELYHLQGGYNPIYSRQVGCHHPAVTDFSQASAGRSAGEDVGERQGLVGRSIFCMAEQRLVDQLTPPSQRIYKVGSYYSFIWSYTVTPQKWPYKWVSRVSSPMFRDFNLTTFDDRFKKLPKDLPGKIPPKIPVYPS